MDEQVIFEFGATKLENVQKAFKSIADHAKTFAQTIKTTAGSAKIADSVFSQKDAQEVSKRLDGLTKAMKGLPKPDKIDLAAAKQQNQVLVESKLKQIDLEKKIQEETEATERRLASQKEQLMKVAQEERARLTQLEKISKEAKDAYDPQRVIDEATAKQKLAKAEKELVEMESNRPQLLVAAIAETEEELRLAKEMEIEQEAITERLAAQGKQINFITIAHETAAMKVDKAKQEILKHSKALSDYQKKGSQGYAEWQAKQEGLIDSLKSYQGEQRNVSKNLASTLKQQLELAEYEIKVRKEGEKHKDAPLFGITADLEGAQELMDDALGRVMELKTQIKAINDGKVTLSATDKWLSQFTKLTNEGTSKLVDNAASFLTTIEKHAPNVAKFVGMLNKNLGDGLKSLMVTVNEFGEASGSDVIGKIGEATEKAQEYSGTIVTVAQKVGSIGPMITKALPALAAIPVIGTGLAGLGVGAAGAAAGIAALAAPLAILAIPLAAIVVGINAYGEHVKKVAEDAREATEKMMQERDRQRNMQRDLDEQIAAAADGDQEARNQFLSDYIKTFEDLDDYNAQAADIQAQLAQAAQEREALIIRQHTDNWMGLNQSMADQVTAIDERIKTMQQDYITMNEEGNNVTGQSLQSLMADVEAMQAAAIALGLTEDEIHAVGLAVSQGSIGAENALAEFEKYADRLREAKNEIADLREETARLIMDHIQEIGSLQESWLEQDAEALDEREYQAMRAQRALNKQLAEEYDNYQREVASTVTTHLEDLEDSYKNHQESIADTWEQYNEQRAETIADFEESQHEAVIDQRESEQEALEDHLKSLAESDEQYKLAKIQREKDLQDQLFDLELANDVLGYMTAQRDGRKAEKEAEEEHARDLEDQKEAFREQKAEAQEAFREQQADALKAHNRALAEAYQNHVENLADMQANYQEEKAVKVAQHAENLLEMARQHEEKKMLDAAQRAEQAALDEEDRQRQLEKQAEQRAEELAEMQDAFAAQLTAQQKKEDDLMVIINSNGVEQVEAHRYYAEQSVAAIVAAYQAGMAPLQSGGYYDTSYDVPMPGGDDGYTPNPLGSFSFRAAGGPIYKGSPTIVGEKGPELIFPESNGMVMSNADLQRLMDTPTKSGNFFGRTDIAMGGGGSSNIVNINGIQITGSGVTEGFVVEVVTAMGQTVVKAMKNASQGRK